MAQDIGGAGGKKPKKPTGTLTMPGIPQPGMGLGPTMGGGFGGGNRGGGGWGGTNSPTPARSGDDNRTPVPQGSGNFQGSTKDLQARLGIKSDGIYGPQTKAAVIAFQKANGLTPDGIAGPKTWAALKGGGSSGGGGNSGTPTMGGIGAGVSLPSFPGGGNPAPAINPAPQSPVGAPAPAPAISNPTPMPAPTSAAQQVQNAQSAVGMEIGPLLNALQRQINLGRSQYDRETDKAQNHSQQAERDLGALYSRLGQFQGQLGLGQEKRYENTQQEVDQNFGALLKGLQGAYGQGQQNTNSELARLGLGEVAPQATEGMARDRQFLGGLAGIDRNNMQANIANQSADFSALTAMQQSNSAAEGTSRISGERRDLTRILDDLRNTQSDREYDLQGQYTDVAGTEGERMRQILEAWNERDWGRSMEEKQMNFQQLMAQKGYDLEKSQVDAAMNAGPSYMDQLDVAKREAEITKLLAELQPKTAAPGLQRGVSAVRRGLW